MALFPFRPAAADLVRLTLVSGQLRRARLPAHDHKAPPAPGALACVSLPGLRGADGSCGGPAPKKPIPVDPMVRVEVGDRVFSTHPVPGTLSPVWDYSVVFDKTFFETLKYADFILYDHDTPDGERLLGGKRVRMPDLLRPGKRKLTVKGGGELTYQVELLPAVPTRQARCKVPAEAELVASGNKDGGCPLFPVAVGDTVEITVLGKGRGDHLVAQLGLSAIPIGARKSFTAEASGLLALAEAGQKGEGPEVAVKVSSPGPASDAPPVSVAPAAGAAVVPVAAAGRTGIPPLRFGTPEPATVAVKEKEAHPAVKAVRPSRGKRPQRLSAATGGQGQAMVEQAVNAHSAELDACTESEENPYGEIALVFSISADGSMLGVTVEKASPNLKNAGECIRRKALRWHFPPPRGTITGRYSMRLSPS